jgi:hypothetical protein
MDHTKLITALHYLRPGCEYNVRDCTIEWLDKNKAEPTPEEINQAVVTLATRPPAPSQRELIDELIKLLPDDNPVKARLIASKGL